MQVESNGGVFSGATSAANTNGTNGLGREEFMRLLMTQMQYQDPLKPMDNTQFVSQLAEFAGLEQLEHMSAGLDNVAMSQASNTSALMVSFIGKTVDVAAPELVVAGDQVSPVGFELAGDASEVEILIKDENGDVVRRLDAGARQSGTNEVIWDGLDDDGAPVADGLYSFQITATDTDGEAVTSNARVGRTVQGVSFQNGVPMLLLDGDSSVGLGNVIEVRS
ncbi:MAG: flagellar basal-body rod modification protein FlgD [Bradymonadia bacterium]|jgi:flagellar basal-body rod modification protein FlgD